MLCGVLPIMVMAGCQATDSIDEAVAAIDQTTSAVQQESSAWRNELPQLQDRLQSLAQNTEGQAAADIRRVLTDSSNQIASMAGDTIALSGLTAEQFVAKFGTEARCNVDFASTRVATSLQQLSESLKFWKKNKKLPAPPTHSVCQVTPDRVEVRATGSDDSWAMTAPDDKIVGVYGYDFRPDALPSIELVDKAGRKVRGSAASVSYVTRYQINVDFATDDLASLAPGVRYVLRWPDKPEPNSVALTLIRPSRLRIVSVAVQPPAPRAQVSAVQPVVTVRNDGGTESKAFVATWTPGPMEPVRSVTVDGLAPGQDTKVTFDPYTYPRHGTFETVVVVGQGSDSYHGTVAVSPYANTPGARQTPMRGQWPNSGGSPGETKDFPVPAVKLGAGCEVDSTRGGGSFMVDDIDVPSTKYTVSWPAGYEFTFAEKTFWRALSALSASFDEQQQEVRAVVTLKGLGGHGGLFPKRGPEVFNGTFTVYTMCPG